MRLLIVLVTLVLTSCDADGACGRRAIRRPAAASPAACGAQAAAQACQTESVAVQSAQACASASAGSGRTRLFGRRLAGCR